jgi:hypothetical protein
MRATPHGTKFGTWLSGLTALGLALVGVGSPLHAAGRMLSGQFPVMVDVDGNGPDDSDARLYLTRCGAAAPTGTSPIYSGDYCLVTPWDECTGQDPSLRLLEPTSELDPVTQRRVVTGVSRVNGQRIQSTHEGAVDANGRPTEYQFMEVKPGRATFEGELAMVDSNDDGRYDFLRAEDTVGNSGFPTFLLGLIGTDVDDDNFPDYASVEWSLQNASTWGVRDCAANGVGPGDPIWVPVAQDPQGDVAVIADLDSNGVADEELRMGPKLALGAPVVSVPTLGEVATLVLAAALLAIGCQQLRRRTVSQTAGR